MENTLDDKYKELLRTILRDGVVKTDRTGTGTKSIFGYQIKHDMKEGFPLLTTKKMAWKSMVVELIWFLRGDTNIKYLVDNGCNIWNGDAHKHYLKSDCAVKWLFNKAGHEPCPLNGPFYRHFTKEEFIEKIKTNDEFASKWGELGPIYGAQWRRWYSGISMGNGSCAEGMTTTGKHLEHFNGEVIRIFHDQIANLVKDLRNNPDSRRLLVNAWNVSELDKMVLPPCHYGFQVYTRDLTLNERAKLAKNKSKFISPMQAESWDRDNIPTRAISLSWNQRSVDTFLGLPFNIASYGLLLEILAKEVNMVPDQLIGNLGDTHLYLNHLEQAEEQIGHELSEDVRRHLWDRKNPTISMSWHHMDNISEFLDEAGIPKRTREPLPLPRVEINDSWKYLSSSPIFADKIELDMIKLFDYESHPAIKAPLSN